MPNLTLIDLILITLAAVGWLVAFIFRWMWRECERENRHVVEFACSCRNSERPETAIQAPNGLTMARFIDQREKARETGRETRNTGMCAGSDDPRNLYPDEITPSLPGIAPKMVIRYDVDDPS